MGYNEKLADIAKQIDEGLVPQQVTARDFIWWFGAQRRSLSNVELIRNALAKHGLVTDPDFEYVYIDSYVSFKRPKEKGNQRGNDLSTNDKIDPTFRIGQLASANKKPISVKPNDKLSKAITLMITHDYSQLPVMTSDWEVKGMITWKSIASQLHLSSNCKTVDEFMEYHKELKSDTYIFAAIDFVIENGYSLIRGLDNSIIGIVTTSDLSQQFRELGEPYLLLGEIEKYLRRMMSRKYKLQEIQQVCKLEDKDRNILKISDLTLGEYKRLLENPEYWNRLNLDIDRHVFINKLEEIRMVRNDVMHFNADTITVDDITKLRDFVRLLQNLARLKAI
jgi:CBS domain-containing protein